MAVFTSKASGNWDSIGTTTWNQANFPVAGDTVTIQNGHVVEVNLATGDEACAMFAINAGGTLLIKQGSKLTTTGANTCNGTFSILGSGSNANPTEFVMATTFSRNAATSVFNFIGTTGVGAPDVKITGGAAGVFNFGSRPYSTDIITQVEFNTGGTATNGLFYSTLDYVGSGSVYSELLFKNMTRIFGGSSVIHSLCLTGNIVFDGTTGGSSMANGMITGSAMIRSINNGANTGKLATPKFLGSVTYWKNDTIGEAVTVGITANFYETARLVHDNVSIGGGVLGVLVMMYDSSSCSLSTLVANQIMFGSGSAISTTGLIEIASAANGIVLINSVLEFILNNLSINVTTGTVVLNQNHLQQSYWQASRSKRFDIVGATAVTLEGTASLPQYEPAGYRYDIAANLNCLQYDMTVGCPNYTALFGTSTGWTAATKTLAAGGVLRILTTGNTATGMDLAIKSFAAAAIAHPLTDTAVVVWTFKVSFDGGVLWSAELTLAQLQADSFIINGNTYTTNGAYDIQLEIIGTSAGGGTLTQVRLTGIEIDPYITSSWSVYQNFKDIEGAGFATGTDDLNTIKDTAKAIKNLAGALQ